LGFRLWLLLVTIFSGFFGAKFRKKVENLERDRAVRVAAGDEKLPVLGTPSYLAANSDKR
jgi:hypothetical protein